MPLRRRLVAAPDAQQHIFVEAAADNLERQRQALR
jgi:hypothetical protein